MHRTGLEMIRRHPWVISMDCTYKTNRYGLPLLDIVGSASTGQTCYIAFAFFQDEKEDNYEVILRCLAEVYDSLNLAYPCTILADKERALVKAIKTVFPHTKTISCIWHIEMNLLKKAHPRLSDQVAIARRDGASLPESLSFTLDQAIAFEQVRRATNQSSLYTKLTYLISSRAIKHVESIRHYYLPEGQGKPLIPPNCTCRSKETTGFPCIHLIKQYQDTHQSFEPELFHQQWHLYKLGEAPPIDPLLLVRDPPPVRRRGRPCGAANFVQPSQALNLQQGTQQSTQQSTHNIIFDRSTQREPSAFEYILPPQERGHGGHGQCGRRRAGPGRPPGRSRRGGQGHTRGRGGRGDAVAIGNRRVLRSSQRGGQGDAEYQDGRI